MKPLVYYGIKEIDKDTLSVSKKLFDEILDEVYAAGFADGQKNSSLLNGGSLLPNTTSWEFQNMGGNKVSMGDAVSYTNSTRGGAVCISPHDCEAGYSKDNGTDPIGD